jgi:hypothetical protein
MRKLVTGRWEMKLTEYLEDMNNKAAGKLRRKQIFPGR